ncbi:MAG: hypothetical protein ACXIVO_08350 [Glycocaulis sp.]
MKRLVSIAVFSAIVLAACESTSSLPYQPSTQNVLAAQRALASSDANLSVGAFSAADGVGKPTCRLMGQLDIAPGKDVATFIRDAFEAELFQTGRLNDEAPRVRGVVEAVDVDTVGTGHWTLTLRVASDANPDGYTVTSTHTFSSSFSAYSACQNAATAFNPAVQSLLNAVVTHPEFSSLGS